MTHDPEQSENIERVSSRIAEAILDFFARRVGKQFHMEELRAFVSSKVGVHLAPASPDRIMRALRQAGKLNYNVVSRKASLYEVLPVPRRPEPAAADAADQPKLF